MSVLEIIGYIVIPFVFVDVFYTLYTLGCKYFMRRRGIDEKDLNKVRKPWVIVCFCVYTILGIISVFVFRESYSNGFFGNVKNEMLLIILLCLITYGVWSMFQQFLHYFGFAKNMYTEIKKSKNEFDHISDKFKTDDKK